MKRRYKVLSVVAILLVGAGSSLALVLSHNLLPQPRRPSAGARRLKQSLSLLRSPEYSSSRNCQAIRACRPNES